MDDMHHKSTLSAPLLTLLSRVSKEELTLPISEISRRIAIVTALVPIAAAVLSSPASSNETIVPIALTSETCADYSGVISATEPTTGMVWIEGGTFTMGDNRYRREEQVAHQVTVDGFWIDQHEVTNAQFRKFVEETGYVTAAERGLDPKEYPTLPPGLLVPGSMVFHEPESVDNLENINQWWRYVAGANWRNPTGPGSDIEGKDNHPVVQVAWEDAKAYADWLGRNLATEAQWEFAARGGLEGQTFAWGETYDPVDGWKANTWQGSFPVKNDEADGHYGTAPVGCFEPNGYGLYDMAGNVWEYAWDWYVPGHPDQPLTNPAGPEQSFAARFAHPDTGPRRVVKGGSWLCAPNFCLRFRPAGRQPQELGLGTNHIGFRTVLNGPS